LIGDCESAALVGRNGSIDWLCWPRFDSDGGVRRFIGQRAKRSLATRASRCRSLSSHARYRTNTLILETRFESDGGAVVLIDFHDAAWQGIGHYSYGAV